MVRIKDPVQNFCNMSYFLSFTGTWKSKIKEDCLVYIFILIQKNIQHSGLFFCMNLANKQDLWNRSLEKKIFN